MKTEVAELNQGSLMRKLGDECFFKMKEINPSGGIREFIRIAVEFGYKKSQSNPKIKQLEWVETDEDGDGIKGIEAITPFGNYEIYEKHDQTGYILWWFDPIPYVFNTQTEAKKFAEDDFEKRLKECLITD